MKILILALSLILAGCSTFVPTKPPQTPEEIVAAARGTIRDANATLTAAALMLAQNRKDGTMSDAEILDYVAKLEKLAKRVDDADTLVQTGVPSAAQQADIVKDLVVTIHREIVKKARQ